MRRKVKNIVRNPFTRKPKVFTLNVMIYESRLLTINGVDSDNSLCSKNVQ